MKILVISHTYIASINREKWKIFSKTYSDIQLKVLIPKKWKATLFDIDAGDVSLDTAQNLEFIALDIKSSGNEVLYRYKFRELAKILKNFQPNIIHVEQGDNAFSYFQTILLAKIFCRKAKFTFFTWINWKQKRSLKYKIFWSWIEKFNLFFSDAAIVGNDAARAILQDKNFKKPIKILCQLGVNENFFKPTLNIKEKKLIGYVGRLVPEKGVFLLVDAFEKLAKIFLNWNLVFVGNGLAEKELQNYVINKKLESRVEFREAVLHEKIGYVLNELEILVLPSYDTSEWMEQFGHILIEAMACKVPVIGSCAGQIPQVIADAGLIFEQKNIFELEQTLKKLIQDDFLRKSLGEQGFIRYKENFSYQIVAENTHSFWCSL
jgi:L-malate glycosyltransferase